MLYSKRFALFNNTNKVITLLSIQFSRYFLVYIDKMNLLRRHIVTTLFWISALTLLSQWDCPHTLFWTAKGIHNPAFNNDTRHATFNAGYTLHWQGIEDAPKELYLSAITPIQLWNLNHNAGITIRNIAMVQERNTLTAGTYALTHERNNNRFTIGIEAGMIELNFDPASWQPRPDSTNTDSDSPTLSNQLIANPTEKKTFNLSAGIAWQTSRFYTGIAARNITQPRYYYLDKTAIDETTSPDSTYTKIPLTVNFIAAYNIPLFHTLFEVEPMLYLQATDKAYYSQLALQLIYNKKYHVGGVWKGNKGYALFVGLKLMDMQLNYAYDIHQRGIGLQSNGTHQISFSYLLPADWTRRKPQPHKSIRLL